MKKGHKCLDPKCAVWHPASTRAPRRAKFRVRMMDRVMFFQSKHRAMMTLKRTTSTIWPDLSKLEQIR